MAVYEYFCPTCQKEFELIRPMSEVDRPASCPQCNSKAQKLVSAFGSRTGGSIQAPGQPFRSTLVTEVSPRRKAKATKVTKRANKRKSVSVVDREMGPCVGPTEEPHGEERDSQPSVTSSALQAIAVPVEDAQGISKVNSCPVAIPIEMSWLIDYQPNGSNLWFIHDWGIASILGYLRGNDNVEDAEAEPPGSVYSQNVTVLEAATPVAADPWVADEPVPIHVDTDSPAKITEIVEDFAGISDQTDELPAVRPWLEEATTQPVESAQHDVQMAEQRVTVYTGHSSSAIEETDGIFSEHVIAAAWKRQGGRCASCGRWLIWTHRNRQGGTGAWQPHSRIQASKVNSVADCVILCSTLADCHFHVGHGGIGWTHHASLNDSKLPFLVDRRAETPGLGTSAGSKRSLLRAIFGIPQPGKPRDTLNSAK